MVCASAATGCLPRMRNGLPAGKTRAGHRRQPGMTTHHAQVSHSCIGDGPSVDVTTWRRCRLLEAGFPEDLADRLAARAVDVHALLQLVDRGCTPELAARILAPIGFAVDRP
jgi:hypothetical protein